MKLLRYGPVSDSEITADYLKNVLWSIKNYLPEWLSIDSGG